MEQSKGTEDQPLAGEGEVGQRGFREAESGTVFMAVPEATLDEEGLIDE